MDRSTIQVSGFPELIRAFRLVAVELNKELQGGLHAIVDMIAQEAVKEATLRGFAPPGLSGRGTGNLIGSIRGGVTMHSGYVKDTAKRDGFSYPRMYEYMNHRERSFLHPAIDNNKEKIYASLWAVVENVNRKFNEGRL